MFFGNIFSDMNEKLKKFLPESIKKLYIEN